MLIADLSNNQGTVDFARLKRAGVWGVWMKVSEGGTWDDPDWILRSKAARKSGLRVGGYHFSRPDKNSAVDEAHHFARVLGKVGFRDLRPVLDFETHPATEAWARTFNHTFKSMTGLTPAFYSYPSFITELKLDRTIGNGLWLASYGKNDGVDHGDVVPAPWKKAVAHQFTSSGKVAGVTGNVDLSHAPRRQGVLAYGIRGLL